MSDYHSTEAQGREFARNWQAAIAKGLEQAEANRAYGTATVVKLEPYEAEELRYFMDSGSKSVSNTEQVHTEQGPAEVAVPEGLEEEKESVVLTDGHDNPKDLDYIPSEEDEEPRPKKFDAMKLVSATKRKDRPFAPPERPTKKKSGPSNSKLVETRTTAHPAAWYTDAAVPKRYTRSQLQNLLYLRTLVVKVQQQAKQTSSEMPNLLGLLRTRLSEIALYDNVSTALLQDSKLLEEGGLPDIINKKGFNFPKDLCADAKAQFHKWVIGEFDPDLFRGIEYKNHTSKTGRVSTSRNLEAGYKFKVSPGYVGQGDLTNGQWWPLQICLLRDGAHGLTEGGISGSRGGVAHSVIVSNSGYADIDNGAQIEYCGTSGQKDKPTPGTKMLLESARRQSPVRVIRSSAIKSTTYLPRKGLRYDGLYDVTQHALLDVDTAMYRFTLVRQRGQGAIRYTGEGARPNVQELETYGRLRQRFGLPA